MKIYGEPLRYPSERYKNLFHTNYDGLLKLLATKSCGSFAIVATADDIKYILTSPGFRKGYIHKPTGQFSEKIGTLISTSDDISIDAVGLASFLGYEGRFTHSHTIRTPFQDITQVKGGKEVRINEGNVEERSYLPLVYDQPTPDFESSFDDALSSLQDSTIALMFSGGKDSTALHAGLSDICGEQNIHPVTVNLNPTIPQGSEALDNSGINSEIIEPAGGWPTTDANIVEHLIKSMKQEFADPLNPYHAISDQSYDYIVGGHNIDAMLCVDMPKAPQMSGRQHAISVASHSEYPFPLVMCHYYITYFFNHILPNFHYWRHYTNNESVRRVYLNILLPLLGTLSRLEYINSDVFDLIDHPDVTTDQASAIAGIITKTLPSKLKPASGLTRTDVIRELNRTRDWWQQHTSLSPAEEMCLLRYYHYAQSVPSCKNTIGSSVSLPACWGPVIPIFLRPITHRDVRRPKAEIQDYIRSKMGNSYSSMRSQQGAQLKSHEQKQKFPFIERLKNEFNQDLLLEQYIESDAVTRVISQINREVFDSAYRDDPRSNRPTIWKAHRLLNVELMIKNV